MIAKISIRFLDGSEHSCDCGKMTEFLLEYDKNGLNFCKMVI